MDKAALEGPLAAFKGKPVSDDLFEALQTADYKKELKGEEKPPIADPAFAKTLFGLDVGPKPLQKDFKKGMVARVGEVLGQ